MSVNNTVESKGKPKKREIIGEVVSDKMNKTVIIRVERRVKHPMYGKVVRKHNKFAVHDENNTAKVGDIVRVIESKPYSKRKRWTLVEIVKTGKEMPL